MIEVRPTIQGDAESLAPRMREADKAEVKAASGKHPCALGFFRLG